MDTTTTEITTAKVGDGNDEGICTVVLADAEGREVRTVEAPEDDLIPYMLTLGYRLGVYLGNYTWRVL